MKNEELPVIAQRFASCKERLRDVSMGQRPMLSQACSSYAERETNLVPVRAEPCRPATGPGRSRDYPKSAQPMTNGEKRKEKSAEHSVRAAAGCQTVLQYNARPPPELRFTLISSLLSLISSLPSPSWLPPEKFLLLRMVHSYWVVALGGRIGN